MLTLTLLITINLLTSISWLVLECHKWLIHSTWKNVILTMKVNSVRLTIWLNILRNWKQISTIHSSSQQNNNLSNLLIWMVSNQNLNPIHLTYLINWQTIKDIIVNTQVVLSIMLANKVYINIKSLILIGINLTSTSKEKQLINALLALNGFQLKTPWENIYAKLIQSQTN